MRWLRRSRRVEYVPIALPDKRPREERWADREYLLSITGFADNGVFLCEVSDALAACRLAADQAKTPEELRGIQVGIRLLRGLLTMPTQAAVLAKAIESRKMEAADDGSDLQLG